MNLRRPMPTWKKARKQERLRMSVRRMERANQEDAYARVVEASSQRLAELSRQIGRTPASERLAEMLAEWDVGLRD